MARARTYSDDQLANAIRTSHSWRGVLRAVGLKATSSSAIRSVRARADATGLDYTHFRGQRMWSEDQLRSAVATSASWQEVVDALGLTGGSGQATVRGHAARLGIDAAHLAPTSSSDTCATEAVPQLDNLPQSGSLLAAGWFALTGHHVSWPLEPCRYDLLVERRGIIQRIQVKTATVRVGRSWAVWLSTTGRSRTPYDVGEVDAFFVIDGELTYYLIPAETVGGLHSIHLSAYTRFSLPQAPLERT